MKDLKLIYKNLKSKYDVTLTNTFSLHDAYTIDVPVIRGVASDRRFDLYKEGDLFVFSVAVFDKAGECKYSHAHPYDVGDAIRYAEEFMSGSVSVKETVPLLRTARIIQCIGYLALFFGSCFNMVNGIAEKRIFGCVITMPLLAVALAGIGCGTVLICKKGKRKW